MHSCKGHQTFVLDTIARKINVTKKHRRCSVKQGAGNDPPVQALEGSPEYKVYRKPPTEDNNPSGPRFSPRGSVQDNEFAMVFHIGDGRREQDAVLRGCQEDTSSLSSDVVCGAAGVSVDDACRVVA